MTTKSKKKKDIIYGAFEIDPDEFAPHNVKVRITTMVDEDALEEFKGIAEKQGVKYQTLLNQLIRSFVSGSSGSNKSSSSNELTEENVRKIVREELRKRA